MKGHVIKYKQMSEEDARREQGGKMVKIEDIVCDGAVYRAVNHRQVISFYQIWLMKLGHRERSAFRNYRCRSTLKNNLNQKLREHQKCDDAAIMSKALKKSQAPFDMIVFRSLDKKENDVMSKLMLHDEYTNLDFKGTHVYDRIPNRYHSSSGYVLFLVPKGYSAAYINNVTTYAFWEREFLIDMNSKCKLIDKYEINEKTCYVVKIQPY